MDRKEFMTAVGNMAAEVVTQAYAKPDNDANMLECSKGQRSFKCIIGNGYIKLGFEGLGTQVGCWWTSSLSIKPHERVLYEYSDGDSHDLVISQLREFFWCCIRKANEFSAKRKLSGFAWPPMRDISEYDVSVDSEEQRDDASGDFEGDETALLGEDGQEVVEPVVTDTVPVRKKKGIFSRRRSVAKSAETSYPDLDALVDAELGVPDSEDSVPAVVKEADDLDGFESLEDYSENE